jgi:hypothetical protein
MNSTRIVQENMNHSFYYDPDLTAFKYLAPEASDNTFVAYPSVHTDINQLCYDLRS